MIFLINHDSQWGRSEVVIIYSDEWNKHEHDVVSVCDVMLDIFWNSVDQLQNHDDDDDDDDDDDEEDTSQ